MKSTSSARIIIRKEAPADEVNALLGKVMSIRGIHHAEVEVGKNWDHQARASKPTGWRYLKVRGTELAVRKVRGECTVSGLEEADQNADHDHAKCIANARSMGVPEAWAHRPETYLSS